MAQQIKKKFIQNDAVDGQKLKIQKDQAVRGQKQDGSEVELLKLDGSDKLVSQGQELAFKSQVDAEQSARESAVSQLQSDLNSEVSSRESEIERVEGLIGDEVEDRIDGDQNLQSQIDTEKGRIDAILLASEADKDSFAEIVQLINSVDTENDSAFASYVLSNNAALAQEVSDRQAGDTSLQNSIDAEETRAMGEESRLEGLIGDEVEDRQAAVSDLQSQIDAEETRAMGVESGLQSQITQEVSDRQAAVSAETSARQSADTQLQSNIDAEKTRAEGVEAGLQSDLDNLDGYAQDIRNDLDQEIIDRAAAVSAEASARQSAISSEESARIAGDASTLQSSKDYTDGKISLVMSNLDTEALDSLVEIVTAFQNADGDLNNAISSLSSSASSALAAEQAARIAADSDLQSQIDALEGVVQGNFDLQQSDIDGLRSDVDALTTSLSNEVASIEDAMSGLNSSILDLEQALATEQAERMNGDEATLSQAQAYTDQEIEALSDAQSVINQGFDSRLTALESQTDGPFFEKQKFIIDSSSELSSVELSHECMENSLVVCVGRLMVHKDEDYSVSVVGGKTVLTWMGEFATGGVEAIEEGDVIFVTFAREV
jgi:hypothetical protein